MRVFSPRFPSVAAVAAVVAQACLLTVLSTNARAAEPPMLGVNLAGGDFGSVPGTYGTDYTYPTEAEFDYYRARNLTLIRLPFKWERIQHTLNAALDATEMARIDAVIGYARARDMKVILDMHNYNKYKLNGTTYAVGSAQVPHSAFKDVWTRIADRYKNEPAIFGYDLMNEPQGTLSNWQDAAQEAIDGIRSKDTRHWVIVEGVGWAGTQSWRSINETLRVNDPAGKLFYSAHSYWDNDHNGAYGSYASEGGHPELGVNYARPFVEWLNENGFNGFIGEYGIPHNSDSAEWNVVLENFLAYCRSNGVSGTYWAGGPWWGDEQLTCEPSPLSDPDRPQMSKLRKYGQLLFEAEEIASSSASKTVSVINEDPLSGGAGEFFEATAVNDYITYTLPDVPAGTYWVTVGVKRFTNRGRFQLDIGGADQGAQQCLYAYGPSYGVCDLGLKTFTTTGNKTFTFTVTGKSSSSSGYPLFIDFICLTENGWGGEPPIIVDNADSTGVTRAGTWSGSTSAPGYHASGYQHDGNTGKGSKSIRFTPTLPSAGYYDVFARWTSDANRASNVPVTVTHATGSDGLVLDQRSNGGAWVLLGTYAFNAGTSGNVLISNTGTNGYVIADAIKFQPRPTQIIVDNADGTGVTLSGSWTASTASSGYYDTNYLHDGNTSKGSKSVRFTPNLPLAGNYQVSVRWPAASNRATNVPIDVVHASGTTTKTVNQQTHHGEWVSLGTYSFNAGAGGSVLIRTTGTNGYVIADAVRFTRQ